MGFIDRWLENAIRQRMPVTLSGDHFRDARDLSEQMEDPVEGWMHVVGCTAITPDVIRAPCHIAYVIQAAGVGLFSGDQVFELQSDQWPNPCDDLPVVFDRDRTHNIQIQWDRLPTHAEWARMHTEQLAQQRNSKARSAVFGKLIVAPTTGV